MGIISKTFLAVIVLILTVFTYDWLNNLYPPFRAATITIISMILFTWIATQLIKKLT